jgi:hypothetical protein
MTPTPRESGPAGNRPFKSALRWLLKCGFFPFRFAWLLFVWLRLRRRLHT